MVYIVTETIEISASPAEVRAKFLDFEQLPNYHQNGFFKSIKTEVPNAPLEPGTKMHNVLEIGEVHALLRENSPSRFQWGGGINGVFTGEHAFMFEPSTKTPGGTTFTQEERFGGALSFVLGENFVARMIGITAKTHRGWSKYNQDLKAWCEGTSNVNK